MYLHYRTGKPLLTSLSSITTYTYSPIVSYAYVFCAYLTSCTYTLSPVPTLPPVPIPCLQYFSVLYLQLLFNPLRAVSSTYVYLASLYVP